MSVRTYASRTDGINAKTGKRIRVFTRCGHDFLHVELGRFAFGAYRMAACSPPS